MTIYLVRHGKAGDRSQWEGPDDLRPLSKAGRKQAEKLAEQLVDASIDRIVTSPYVRCRQSVEPVAEQRRLPVDLADELAEGAPLADALRLIEKVAHENTVLCTHGDVVGDLLHHLDRKGVPLGDVVKLQKGSTWMLEVEGGEIVAARYLPPPA
ncbi:MAG: histidine phosphatase family protein [Actinobacteria bacterium]|nr:histidine phosphatase family protein [Actinomycetota bacterium]